MCLRRCVAVALLLGYSASSAEAVVGVVRDGAVHHESAATAAVHNETERGDHGHEDPAAAESEHGRDHQHGTAGDHCTHTHGTSLPSGYDFEVPACAETAVEIVLRSLSGTSEGSHFRPPKA